MKQTLRPIELLAPARDADIAIQAIAHGADAVYIGGPSHGARQSAANSTADIARVVDYAHRFRARVYVTLNTLVYPSELTAVERLVGELYRIGVDALIVQDMALLRLDIPPIALHASTQTDIRTPEKARFMAEAGFSQLVLPREMTLDEMAEIHRTVPGTSLEAFVHGALCVSYSGDCQAGWVTRRRSANRGECPQICRHRFDLVDADGNCLISGRHLLSLRDLNRSEAVGDMLDAGISSFKIEGRLKDAAYVKNTVAAYRAILDEAIALRSDSLVRASIGSSAISFNPDLQQSFNRGYTSYFTNSARPAQKMASILTPKWIGPAVGTVRARQGNAIKATLTTSLSNGDGLGYFDRDKTFQGFLLNRVEGSTLYPARPVDIPVGTTLYRNHNRLREQALESDNTARRTIDCSVTLRLTPGGIALDASTESGINVSVAESMKLDEAKAPQEERRRLTLVKTGDTDFTVSSVTDLAGNSFIPMSTLTALRRRLTDALAMTIATTHPFDYRRPENREVRWPSEAPLTYHDNVANPQALEFYRSHGAIVASRALETADELPDGELRVMTTRYCLRREMGCCLRTPDGSRWPDTLYLVSGPDRFRLKFDCRNCRMHVIADKKR